MSIIVISRVKNEIDIIEAFVRHTLAVADQHLVIDHDSTDGTLELLHDLKSSGLPLNIFESHTFARQHWASMSKFMCEAASIYGADWILPLDADEFVSAESGGTLRETLQERLEANLPLQIYWRTYVPDPSDDPLEINPALRLRHRLLVESRPWSKVIIPGRLALHPHAGLAPGNHGITINDGLCEATPLSNIHLAHFPVRSVGQYAAKVVTAHLRYRATPNREAGQGFHYDYPYQLLKNDYRTFAESIYEFARRYAVPPDQEFVAETILDPLHYLGGTPTFTKNYDERQAPISNVLTFAEKLADHYARMALSVSDDAQATAFYESSVPRSSDES